MTVKWTPAPDLAPPPLDTGAAGWMKRNLFSSVRSTVLTVAGFWIIIAVVPPFIRWAVVNAAWVGNSKEACVHLSEDGISGACWVFIKVRLGMFMYGFYPGVERWRVNLTLLLLAAAALPLLAPRTMGNTPASLGFAAACVAAVFVLFGPGPGLAAAVLLLAPFALSYVRLKFRATSEPRAAVKAWQWTFLFTVYPIVAYFLLAGGVFGLVHVETHLWGGMFLTLVIAGVGIATSLPIGILLALGRRSRMPVTRTLCICFIELIRGVPLISVLFMASIMLPLFLPEGAHFNKLLRALIGVSLFYAAYMAEVVRGGLQAIPKGQYEAAESLGCGYWRMMGLIILPQALRLVIPGIVNTFLGLFKDTTLVAVIGLMDMLGIVKTALADTEWLGFPKEAYVFAAAVFWVFCFGMSRYSMLLERRFQVRRY